MTALNEVAQSMPVRFDPQSLINPDAAARPWNRLPAQFPWTIFDPEGLSSYDATVRSRLLEAIRTQPILTQPHRVEVRTESLEALFGPFTPDHAFLALSPDWGIRLTETMATRGLAHLLGRGSGSLKANAFGRSWRH